MGNRRASDRLHQSRRKRRHFRLRGGHNRRKRHIGLSIWRAAAFGDTGVCGERRYGKSQAADDRKPTLLPVGGFISSFHFNHGTPRTRLCYEMTG
jgi:hypothetical protein